MKRHQNLQALSREHHSALQLALKAKRAAMSGDQAKIDTTAAACVAAFSAELNPHFEIEETTLLPLLLEVGEDKLMAKVERDHKALRCLAVQMERPDAKTLRSFAELLTSHVRFEEREMFVVIERLLAD